jgi:hypothetical protein
MDPARQSQLAAMVSDLFPPGEPVGFERDSSVVEIRERDKHAVILFRWDGEPHLYGIPVPLDDVRHEFYYSDYTVSSDEEWLDSVTTGLGVMLDTGHRATARRTRVDDYIELRSEGGWPIDERFYLRTVDESHELLAERLREDGLDPSAALESRAQDRLVTWLLSYENNSTGTPYVGQAVVSSTGEGSAHLELVETTAGVPQTVALELAYFAAHDAVAAGARVVTTDVSLPTVELAGFAPDRSGALTLDTSFATADPDAARALLDAERATPHAPWGRDRDRAGRPLPSSRTGRLLHRLRWGRSGGRQRTYRSYVR